MNRSHLLVLGCLLLSTLGIGLVAASASGDTGAATGEPVETNTMTHHPGASGAQIANDRTPAARPVPSTDIKSERLSQDQSITAVEETITFRPYPPTDGIVEATLSYDIPGSIDEFVLWLDGEIERIVERDGFDQTDDREFTWDGSTPEPSVTVRLAVNRIDDSGYVSAIDGESWALFSPFESGILDSWAWHPDAPADEPILDWKTTVEGPGVTGTQADDFVFIGAYDEYEREAESETVRLVVPDAAALSMTPESILDLLAWTSDTVSVGARNDVSTVVAAPNPGEGLEYRSFGRTWESISWVEDYVANETVEGWSNVWIHEYMHQRQDFETAVDSNAEWLIEGQAEYYGVLYNYVLGNIEFDELRTHLERGQESEYDSVVLTQPDTWVGTLPDYYVGALAVAAIDVDIRTATDGEASFEDVVRELNRAESIDHEEFVEIVRDVGGDEAAAAADRYVSTTQRPSTWDESTFADHLSPAQEGDGAGDNDGGSDDDESIDDGEDGGDSDGEAGTGDGDEDAESPPLGGEPANTSDADDGGPGFGPVPAVLAVALTGVALRRRLAEE